MGNPPLLSCLYCQYQQKPYFLGSDRNWNGYDSCERYHQGWKITEYCIKDPRDAAVLNAGIITMDGSTDLCVMDVYHTTANGLGSFKYMMNLI